MLSHEGPIAGLVVSVVDPQPGETIIDCCAAPGGKTLFMASRLSGQGKKMELRVGFNSQLLLKHANYSKVVLLLSHVTSMPFIILCFVKHAYDPYEKYVSECSNEPLSICYY